MNTDAMNDNMKLKRSDRFFQVKNILLSSALLIASVLGFSFASFLTFTGLLCLVKVIHESIQGDIAVTPFIFGSICIATISLGVLFTVYSIRIFRRALYPIV